VCVCASEHFCVSSDAFTESESTITRYGGGLRLEEPALEVDKSAGIIDGIDAL